MFRDMVETAGVTQDLEWQVQADLAEEEEEEEVEVEVDEEVKEEEEEDTEEANKEEGGDDSPLILRHPRRHTGHVTFGHNDIRPISTNLERSRSAKKEKKEREREERELADVKEEVVAVLNIIIPILFHYYQVVGEIRERKNSLSAFSWITNSMRRMKKKPKPGPDPQVASF